MKIKLPCLISVLFVIVSGCASNTTSTGEPIPRYASRIQIARYDNATRSPSTDFQVFAEAASVKRPYRIIALLAHKAKPGDAPAMLNAIAWNARQLGADGMIILGSASGGWKFDNFGGKSEEPIFSANAIIYTDK